MMKTTIQFWSGLQTIGGNIASIQYGNDRVIFDFGLVYDPVNNVLDHHIQMREESGVIDYLKLGLIPALPGIYAKKELLQDKLGEYSQLESCDESHINTAVFISHLHLDHMGAVGFIDPKVPVYLSEPSLALYNVLAEVGENVKGSRDYSSFVYENAVHIGEIIVTPIKVDHDVLGATSFHIQTPDGTFVYSGDLRMHGQHPEWNTHWVEKVKELGVDVLLIEGTTLSPTTDSRTVKKEVVTEVEIPSIVENIGTKYNGLMLFNMYQRNTDRIENFSKAATKVNRKLVFEPETAYIAHCLKLKAEFSLFMTEKDNKLLESSNLPAWKESIYNQYEIVRADDINENPGHYILQNSYHHLLQLLDLKLEQAVYIHANGVPLGEFDPAYHNLLRFLEKYKVAFQPLTISGHAYKEDLFALADNIKPNYIIPWHSYHPNLFKSSYSEILLPKYNTQYNLKNGKLEIEIGE